MTHPKKNTAVTGNPKLDPNPPSNTQKEVDEWVSGDDPMTGAEASSLKTLCRSCERNNIRVLLWMLDGAERRHHLARRWQGQAARDLHVEVEGGAIMVTLRVTSYAVTYYSYAYPSQIWELGPAHKHSAGN